MGMSTHVIGFKPPDSTWRKMKAVYDSCIAEGVNVPNDVQQYFNFDVPDDSGVEVDLTSVLEAWRAESQQGLQLDLSKLPKDVKIIRFFNAW